MQPIYKSLKITFTTWQALTHIAAQTGEPRTQVVHRLVKTELERVQKKNEPVC